MDYNSRQYWSDVVNLLPNEETAVPLQLDLLALDSTNDPAPARVDGAPLQPEQRPWVPQKRVLLASLFEISGLLANAVVGQVPSEGGIYYFINDHLGTPQKIMDQSGAVVWSGDYRPFGSVNAAVSDVGNSFRFPGQYHDQETGLHYNWNRYYDPKSGRYLTADPIGLEGGINLYIYASKNPVNSVDPSGLDAIYVNYDYYPVSTPVGDLPLGHGAAVAVDPKTGVTKYYEFGRYGDNRGVVRGSPDIQIPNLKIGDNGLPTQKSLDNLYDFLSKNFGKNSKISPIYYPDSDFQGTIDFAEKFRRNHPDYNLFTNNCKTFGKAAATACREGDQCK